MIRRWWHGFWFDYHVAMMKNYYDGDDIRNITISQYSRFEEEREYHHKWKEYHAARK